MVELLKECCKIIIGFVVVFSMGMSILFPFMIEMKDCPYWLAFIIYPISIISIAYMRLNPDKYQNNK